MSVLCLRLSYTPIVPATCRITAIGRILPLLVPWDAPVYVTRAWCLFELFTAIRHRRDVEINIIVPPSQRGAFAAALASRDHRALERVLDSIQSVDATASEPADLAAIRGSVPIHHLIRIHGRTSICLRAACRVIFGV